MSAIGTSLAALVAVLCIPGLPLEQLGETSVARPDVGPAPRLEARVVQRGLAIPWDVAFAPDGRMFVTERDRDRIVVYASGAPGATRLTTRVISGLSGFSAGPMGLVLHPRFSANGRLYVCATRISAGRDQPTLQVLRFFVGGSGTATRIVFSTVILDTGEVGSTVNSGCRLRFDESGMLWVTTGHGRRATTSGDPGSLMGKVLRLTASGAVPPDNPVMPGASSATAVYSMGHRNPQGLDLRPSTGAPYLVEHGPDRDDEINVIRPGRHYGWPEVMGSDGAGGYADPAWASGYPSIAPSGGAFVTSDAWGAWRGDLFVATLKESDLRRFRLSADGAVATQKAILFDGVHGRLRTVARGPGGSLYVTTSNSAFGEATDRILRVRPTPP